jgi:copper chaperone CopZ
MGCGDKVYSQLKALPGVEKVEHKGGKVFVATAKPDADAEQVVQSVKSRFTSGKYTLGRSNPSSN